MYPLTPDDLIKVLLALAVGGWIGLEREFRDKAAGLRTMIFNCLGAALFTIFSVRMAGDREPTRIAANIVVGVGFLGAGVIMRQSGGRLTGLTTAATIWLVAALGAGIGSGNYALSVIVAAIAFMVLWLFPGFERIVNAIYTERAYHVVTPIRDGKLAELDELFRAHHLRVLRFHQEKKDGCIVSFWYAAGREQAHERLRERLAHDPDVLEFQI